MDFGHGQLTIQNIEMWTYRGSTAGQMDEVRPWRPDLDDGS